MMIKSQLSRGKFEIFVFRLFENALALPLSPASNIQLSQLRECQRKRLVLSGSSAYVTLGWEERPNVIRL